MEQFKSLPAAERYFYAWHWLGGYFDGALDLRGHLTRPALRTVLDRMRRFADWGPWDEATATGDYNPPLNLSTDAARLGYDFAFHLLLGYLEAAHYHRAKGLTRTDLLHVLEQMEAFAPQTAPAAAPVSN